MTYLDEFRLFLANKRVHLALVAIVSSVMTVADIVASYVHAGGHPADLRSLALIGVGAAFYVAYTVASHLEVIHGGALTSPAAQEAVRAITTDLIEGKTADAQAAAVAAAQTAARDAVVELVTNQPIAPVVPPNTTPAITMSQPATPAGG